MARAVSLHRRRPNLFTVFVFQGPQGPGFLGKRLSDACPVGCMCGSPIDAKLRPNACAQTPAQVPREGVVIPLKDLDRRVIPNRGRSGQR